MLLAAAGCGGGAKRASLANDRLRAKNMQLTDEVRRLTLHNEELAARLEEATSEPRPLPDEYRSHVPRVAALSIDSRSHVRDDDGDGRPDRLIVYVAPRDGLDRFVQIVGRLTVQAAVLPDDVDAITLGRITLGPVEVRQAYRSSLMGTHYAVEVPLAPAADLDAVECIVQVEFVDAFDGREFADHRGIGLKP